MTDIPSTTLGDFAVGDPLYCMVCGMVYSGDHICAKAEASHYGYTWSRSPDWDAFGEQLKRIADALERIANNGTSLE